MTYHTTVTIFEYPKVVIKNEVVKLELKPKLLGVTFDIMFNFSHHIKATVDSAKTKVSIMKSLADATWGQDQETLSMTYKAIVRSVLEYAPPIWSPIIPDSSWQKLQTVQKKP